MQEIWKDIAGYKGKYQVSNLGNVRSLNYNKTKQVKLLSQNTKRTGYKEVALFQSDKAKWYLVHRVVAKTFIPNPENKPEVNHIDGNKLNNQSSNLEWVTRSENSIHAYKLGLRKAPRRPSKGEKNGRAKLKKRHVLEIRKLYSSGDLTYKQIAEMYGVDISSIYDIVKRRSWKHLEV